MLPGFKLALSFTLFWLAFIVLMPILALVMRGVALPASDFWAVLGDPRVRSAFGLSFGAAAAAAAMNSVFGLIVAWALVRYRFVGRRIIDAMIDLPFALPTSVAGIALTSVYSENGLLGAPLAKLGLRVAYTPLGVWVALVFIGLPFVVRTVQPVLQDLDPSVEEAATMLGASPRQRFWRVILPELVPALGTGFILALARGLGEYGSVVFISGNMPLSTEILPLLIVSKLEQYDYSGATVLALLMLVAATFLLLALNGLSRWQRRYTEESP